MRVGNLIIPCRLGRSGIKPLKREGDGATPAGRWTLRHVLFRSDRITRPLTRLAGRAMRRGDGWCDAPEDRNYNRPVRLPYPASHENLWRNDRLYDVVVILSHNERPRQRYHGSAVFLHMADPEGRPTAGCIAVAPRDMARLLTLCGPETSLVIGPTASRKSPSRPSHRSHHRRLRPRNRRSCPC
ncbi:MAG: L,D-transpeptidase family protein [Rhizobiales bacterium]|nr:L,D-transpeptidase family protein [Hyphomicrobiales bacterium]